VIQAAVHKLQLMKSTAPTDGAAANIAGAGLKGLVEKELP